MFGSDFIAILALLTAMFTIRNLIFKSFPLVYCDSNLRQLSKGFFLSRRYSVIGFRTEWNTRNYMCLLDVSFMSVYSFLVGCVISSNLFLEDYASGMKFYVAVNFILTMCIMIWHLSQCYRMHKRIDRYCIILGTMITSFLHVLTYYDCIFIKNRFLEIDLVFNPIAIILMVLFLFSISYYPHTINQDCLFCIHFGIEDDEVKISVKGGRVVSSIEKFFLPVILDNGDVLIYGITNGRKNLDEVIKAEEIITFCHAGEEFVFNANTRKWYHCEDGKKPSHLYSNPIKA